MNTLNLIAFSVLALLVAVFTILLPVAIIFNMKAGMKYRQDLARKLDKLRLGKMLVALGIDVDEYLAQRPGIDIHNHMERCSSCSNTAECDDKLAGKQLDAGHISFCNNEESLQELVRDRGE